MCGAPLVCGQLDSALLCLDGPIWVRHACIVHLLSSCLADVRLPLYVGQQLAIGLNRQMVQGGTTNTVVLPMGDHFILFGSLLSLYSSTHFYIKRQSFSFVVCVNTCRSLTGSCCAVLSQCKHILSFQFLVSHVNLLKYIVCTVGSITVSIV